MPTVLDKHLVFVTGKGGVGRSTVAAALGLASAARGRRTLLVEVAEQDRVSRAFGREGVGSTETELVDGLWGASIVPQDALKEWLSRQLGGALPRLLLSSNAFQYFVAAAPGGQELITVAKIWEMAQAQRWSSSARAYDLVVVDAPASGHGLAMLRAPRTYAEIARVGPIHRQAEKVAALLRERGRTGYVAVARPEEMPVNETLDFEGRLTDELGAGFDAIVVNAMYPRRFRAPEAEALEAIDDDGGDAAAAVRAALVEHRRAGAQHAQLQRLRRKARAPVVTLPFLFQARLDVDALRLLAHELEGRLERAAKRGAAAPAR